MVPNVQMAALYIYCGTVCALSIANSTLVTLPIFSLLILFYLILFSNVLFYFST